MTDDDLKSALARLPVPRLDADRRRTIAAEVLARADLHDDTRRRPSFVPYGVAAIAAAAVVVLVLGRDEHGFGSRLEQRSAVAVESEPIAPPVASEYAGSARVPDSPRRDEGDTKDAKGLEDRTRSRAGQPADRPAAVEIRRKQRQEFAATDNRQGAVIERETRELEASTVLAFREGWEALRAGRYAEAIAAFDRATDPAVAEDAAFWAAIAAQRAGNIAGARKRLADFLARFPDSPRADRAREVLR